MTFFVYKHTNKINGKAYIGWTSLTLEKRFKTHLSQAKSGSCYAFHRALRKYNIDNWLSETLGEYFSKAEAKKAEIDLIKEHGTFVTENGYNMTKGGDGSVDHIKTFETLKNNRGDKHCHAKLTQEQVFNVKERFLSGLTQTELSEQFNVTQSTISRILTGRTYIDCKLSDDAESEIKKLLFERSIHKHKFVKLSTRLKVSLNRRGSNNGMFNKRGVCSPNFGSKRSEQSKQLMREKALLRELNKRIKKEQQI